MLRYIIILFFLIIQLSSFANNENGREVIVYDLQDEWLVYNKDYKAFFPFLDNENKKNIISASLLLDLEKYSGYHLNFKASPGLSLFIENKLFYKNYSDSAENVKIKINDLITSNGKKVLTFFNAKGNLPINKIFIGFLTTQGKESFVKDLKIIPRNLHTASSIYIITFLMIVAGIAIIKNRYPKKFNELLSFSSLLPDFDHNIILEISNFPVVLLILINSFSASLILFVIKQEFDLNSLDFLNIFSDNSVLGILIVSGAVFMIYILKYFQLKVLGWIFNLKEIVKFQFIELMRVSLKVNMLLTVLIIIFYTSGFFNVNFQLPYFIYFTIFSLLIVLLRVGYLTFTLSGFRNVYLFSYLCTTEILPLVILVKLILL